MADHYNTMVRWVRLQNRERKNEKNLQIKGYENYNTFMSYMSSLVYTLLEVKRGKIIKS